MDIIYGRNSVKSALKGGVQLDRIYVAEGTPDGSIRELLKLAKVIGIPIKEVSQKKLDELCEGLGYGNKPVNHQGIVAQAPAIEYGDIDDIFALANSRGQTPFIIIADGIQDPHNLGAVIRSAEAFGAHGVIISKHRSALLTSTVYKTSSGAAAYIPIVKVTNINRTIDLLKDKGVWIAASDPDGQSAFTIDLKGPLALVIGSEGYGIPKHTKELADYIISIPMNGKTESLNASCAAAILMYEKVRQDLYDFK